MPQLHLYAPEQFADRVRKEAAAVGTSVSRSLAEVVKRELHPQQSASFFEEVMGGWHGEQLQCAEAGAFDVRDTVLFEGSLCICILLHTKSSAPGLPARNRIIAQVIQRTG